jgi:hypothetical protein
MPIRTTSALYPVRLREDLPPDVARSYWAGPHAEIVTNLPHVMEYNQYHFSSTDHGFWPATPKVGTKIPSSWPIDGLTEVRLPSMSAALRVPLHMREVFFDEQNVFEHCLPIVHATFGVSHANPSHRRYHGAVIFGAGSRDETDKIIASLEVKATIDDQHITCIALHAFGVDRTEPVIRMGHGVQK